MSDLDPQTALTDIAADPRLAAVYEYWRTLPGENAVPAFSQLDPVGLPPTVLPYLTLLDVADGGRTFCVRLVGTGTTLAVERNFTGAHLDAVAAGDILEAALERYRFVVARRRPVLDIVEYVTQDGSSFKNRLMTMPFSTGDSLVDRLLGVYSPSSAGAAQRTLRNLTTPSDVRAIRSQVAL